MAQFIILVEPMSKQQLTTVGVMTQSRDIPCNSKANIVTDYRR